jgi:hypothetical protein
MKQEQYTYIDEYGDKFYYKDREMTIYYRIDGPAVEWSTEEKFNTLTAPLEFPLLILLYLGLLLYYIIKETL